MKFYGPLTEKMWLEGLLFVLLSPGVILTLPPSSKGVFFSGQTSVLAVLLHALVFVFLLHIAFSYSVTAARDLFGSSCDASFCKGGQC